MSTKSTSDTFTVHFDKNPAFADSKIKDAKPGDKGKCEVKYTILANRPGDGIDFQIDAVIPDDYEETKETDETVDTAPPMTSSLGGGYADEPPMPSAAAMMIKRKAAA